MNRRDLILSEVKTLVGVLSKWGNVLVPAIDDKETTAHQRLQHFVELAQSELGMSLDEIDEAISA